MIAALLYLLVSLAGTVSAGKSASKKSPVFKPGDYPNSEFKVTQSVHTLGDINIRIIHAKRRKEIQTPPSFCRAWVEISRGVTLIRRIYYNDFEPVGYKYGVFVPAKQPSADYFVLVKEGDYAGDLLLIDGAGDVTDTFGGSFFIARERFLVSQYSSDEAGLAVFDLKTHKLILKTSDIPFIQNWYKDSAGYFFTESEWRDRSSEPHEKEGIAYRLNLQQGKIIKVDMDSTRMRSAAAVKYDFDPSQYDDCVSR
jgi:hypothetical protein